ncbi:MAG: branched-chain amino acid ABC transporter permease [Phycisphaeraceae bacterium]
MLETLIHGISTGSLYALIALGYTMVYGVLQFINFAHGDLVMVGAWLSLIIATSLGFSADSGIGGVLAAVFVMLISMVLCGGMGVLVERLAYRPLRQAPRLNILTTAIGVSLLIQNTGQLPFVFGTETGTMTALINDSLPMFHLGDVPIYTLDVIILTLAIGLMFALDRLVYRSKVGLAMRGVSHDVDTTALMGVNVDRVISLTFFIGTSLAAAGGTLYILKYRQVQQPADLSWIMLGLKAFVAAVVGGIGNIRGAMLGGMLIGLLEQFTRRYQSPELSDIYVFALLIVVLLAKPTGIMGKPVRTKV